MRSLYKITEMRIYGILYDIQYKVYMKKQKGFTGVDTRKFLQHTYTKKAFLTY